MEEAAARRMKRPQLRARLGSTVNSCTPSSQNAQEDPVPQNTLHKLTSSAAVHWSCRFVIAMDLKRD